MRSQLGYMLARAGRMDEGFAALQQSLKSLKENHPAGHQYVADTQILLGFVQLRREAPSEAELLFRDAIRFRQSYLPATHAEVAEAQCGLASALAAQARYNEASPIFRQNFTRFRDWGLADRTEVERSRVSWTDVSTSLWIHLGTSGDLDELLEWLGLPSRAPPLAPAAAADSIPFEWA